MASYYAAHHPDALDGLVLIGSTGDPTGRLALLYRAIAWLTERLDQARLARFRNKIARLAHLNTGQDPPTATYMTLSVAWRAVMNDCPPDLLRDVASPVLLINGQLDQMRVGERRYLSLAREGALLLVPKATHLAPMTHSQQVAARIWAFTEGIIRRRASASQPAVHT